MSRIVDFMNAEVVNGSVTNVADAVQWLGYSYWYVRSLRNPSLYKASLDRDTDLTRHRTNVARAALRTLEDNGLVTFQHEMVATTPLGRVAAIYAVSYNA